MSGFSYVWKDVQDVTVGEMLRSSSGRGIVEKKEQRNGVWFLTLNNGRVVQRYPGAKVQVQALVL